MKTALEDPISDADTTNSPLNTEFFTCFDIHPSLVSDLNDKRSTPTLVTVGESDSVNLERNDAEDDSLLTGSENTPRPAGLPPHIESQTSPTNSTLKDIFQGADMLETNATEVTIALVESTGSGGSCFIGEGRGKMQGSMIDGNGNDASEETAEDFRGEHPHVDAASESASSKMPAMKMSFTHRAKKVWRRATSLKLLPTVQRG
ncbi:hypothetical protein F5141DRAFT_1149705 [Pisolithus sp. B1]|nr:hypothetical protein F5141DRAFT_1149705 [Pisolithus sp. B1]